jgi:hypothetical protein
MHRIPVALMFPLLLLASALWGVGCAPKKVPTHVTPQPNPPSPVMTNPDARAAALQQRSAALQQAVKQLPGRTPDQDRRLVAGAFDDASGALELLGGPDAGGAFRQQLRIIQNTTSFLKTGPSTVSPEPSIDTGLRSLEDALTSVRERLFPVDQKLDKPMSNLSEQIRQLDTVSGPTHALVVSLAFTSAADVIARMSGELSSRSQSGTPAPAPSHATSAPHH